MWVDIILKFVYTINMGQRYLRIKKFQMRKGLHMKYLIYGLTAFVACLLFLPESGSTEIRNLPFLIFLLSLVLLCRVIRLMRYVLLLAKTKSLLKKNNVAEIKEKCLPWSSFFHGRYSVSFLHNERRVQIILLSKKWNYQRYHFDSINHLEFYRSNRVVFNNIKALGPTVSNLVETKRVGKQSLIWEESANCRVVLFDRLPPAVTDSAKQEYLGVGDHLCGSNVSLLDWATLRKTANGNVKE